MTRLTTELLNGYSPNVRPGRNYADHAQDLNISFYMKGLQSFDEISSQFSVLGYFKITWYDERLSWDPTKFGNIYWTRLKQKDIWVPHFILGNSAEDVELIGTDDQFAVIVYSGLVQWYPGGRFVSVCDADVTLYPFDTQLCTLQFLTWTYISSELKLNPDKKVGMMLFVDNPIWDVKNTEIVVTEQPVNYVEIRIRIKRRSTFIIVNFILPVIFLCFINVCVFILPVESGERVGYSITVLLAVAVFLSIIASALPQTSTPQIALLCYLLIALVVYSMMITICTVLGVRFYFKPDDERVPVKIATLTRFVNCTCCRHNVSSIIASDPVDVSEVEAVSGEKNTKLELSKPVILRNMKVSWKDVGKAFDKSCFIVYLILAILLNSVFLMTVSIT